MNFVLGMIIGGMLVSGSGNPAAQMLSQIPLRCLAALERSEAEYKNCRRLSLAFEIVQQYSNTSNDRSKVNRSDLEGLIETGLDLEVSALRTVAKEAAAAQERR